nr:MAG TPA: hypothetical protein [Caudoviricetes sp.]
MLKIIYYLCNVFRTEHAPKIRKKARLYKF